MRWWLITDPPFLFSADNSSAKGMDYSTLDPDIWMVEWRDGRGELERQNEDGTNQNGLRENFVDIIPYCPFFDQFLELLKAKALTLTQAKKVKAELINEVFNAKRQAPFHYPVAAGDYWWDAADSTLFASTVPALQNAIAKVNEIIARLNSQFPALKGVDDQLSNRDESVIGYTNAYVVNPGDTLTGQINVNIVTQAALLVNEINGSIVNYANSNAANLNGSLQSTQTQIGETSVAVARPGLSPGQILNTPGIGTNLFGVNADFLTIPALGPVASVGWSAMSNVVQSNTSWIPIGGTAPVPVTPAEAGAIMQGIAARTNALNIKKNVKLGELNALTTIDDVIAYDVTIGW